MKKHSFLILASLFAMTSVTQAKSPSSAVQLTTEFEQPVLAAGESQRAIVKISLLPDRIEAAEERPPVNLAIALDRSGSMDGDKIVQARNAALEALSLLGTRDRFSLIAYSDEAETLIESQHPLEREHLARIIRNIQSDGSTALYAGVSQAAAELRRGRSDGAFNRLILLSDGKANKGPSSVEDLSGLSLSLAGEDISVSTVGLGPGFNEDLMTAMAEAAQGNAYFAENSNDLTRIFAAELDDVLNVAATNVHIIIECGNGTKPVRIIGRDGQINDGTVSLKINQLFGGQEKYALLEVDAPAGTDGDVADLLNVRVTYDDANTGREVSQSAVAKVNYSNSEETVKEAANVEVARAVIDNRVAETKREAIALSDHGQHKQAAQLMHDLKDEVTRINVVYDDAELTAEADQIEAEAAELAKAKLSNMQRKRYSNSSYNTFNQQKSID